jgi:hypothetical protein
MGGVFASTLAQDITKRQAVGAGATGATSQFSRLLATIQHDRGDDLVRAGERLEQAGISPTARAEIPASATSTYSTGGSQ